jgi:single-stranded-DNA-specific exonuclease
MEPSRRRWELRPIACEATLRELQSQLNDLPEALARALMLRGIGTFEDAKLFFRPSREHLHDPYLMSGMDVGADRIVRAIERGEKVVVYGDYDVDGTTATALMTSFLIDLGVEATYFIPDRFTDGYGLKRRGIDAAVECGASLIVALDCGITAVDEALYARARGVDLMICDHHMPKAVLPDALAVMDPKRADCQYPFKELSGCGIGFKLACAVLSRLGRPLDLALRHLDLVAISTASDIVPMVGENRILMREGLEVLRRAPRPGLARLAENASIDLRLASTSEIVFGIGPRINAAGRMAHASLAVDLLMTQDDVEAARLAGEIEAINQRRRRTDSETESAACLAAQEYLDAGFSHSIVLYDESWHAGVIGIVASRLVDRFHRPSIMLTKSHGEAKGSARSIAGLNIFDALNTCSDLLNAFGGHYFAAGLSLDVENLSEFRRRFDAVAAERLDAEALQPAIDVDANIELHELDQRFWAVLRQFEPFGPDNLAPVFHARRVGLCRPPQRMGSDGKHLRFQVKDLEHRGESWPVVAFSMGDLFDDADRSFRQGVPLEMLFSMEENRFRGRTTLQCKARDFRLSAD